MFFGMLFIKILSETTHRSTMQQADAANARDNLDDMRAKVDAFIKLVNNARPKKMDLVSF